MRPKDRNQGLQLLGTCLEYIRSQLRTFIESLLCAIHCARKWVVLRQFLPEQEGSHGETVMTTE